MAIRELETAASSIELQIRVSIHSTQQCSKQQSAHLVQNSKGAGHSFLMPSSPCICSLPSRRAHARVQCFKSNPLCSPWESCMLHFEVLLSSNLFRHRVPRFPISTLDSNGTCHSSISGRLFFCCSWLSGQQAIPDKSECHHLIAIGMRRSQHRTKARESAATSQLKSQFGRRP